MQDQTNIKHSERQIGRQQVWLLPICFLLAILLALVFLKPDHHVTSESTETTQKQSESTESNAEATIESLSVPEPSQAGAINKSLGPSN